VSRIVNKSRNEAKQPRFPILGIPVGELIIEAIAILDKVSKLKLT
jgi:hypothetical protein